MEQVPQALTNATVLDETGQPHQLGELWQKRPAVILWVRHFGCMFCTQQVEQFRPHIVELRQAGVDVAVVGSGAPNFVRGFKERLGLDDLPIFSDEKRESYQALEMKRGWSTLLDPRVIATGVTAIFKYRQRSMQGDNTQQGGVVVVRPDGTMPFKYISQYAGDHAKPEDIVRAALAATERAAS